MRRSLTLFCTLLVALGGCRPAGKHLRIGGGPTGGTFYRFAEGMVPVIAPAMPQVRFTVERSGGSLANLERVEQGEYDLALVYAGDAYLGSRGRLQKNLSPTSRVLAVARLYGATAQLAVLAGSPVHTPSDLKKKRVDIGNPGSGAALSAERYFRSLGLWEEIVPVYLGYAMAANDLTKGAVEAVWELVGVPSASLTELSSNRKIRLLDLQKPAEESSFWQDYPFYTPAVIPAGTYPGQEKEVSAFQDATLLVAGPQVSAKTVHDMLERLFSDQGLARMRQVHPVAADMSAEKALAGVAIPLHPGARKFWEERGMLPPAE